MKGRKMRYIAPDLVRVKTFDPIATKGSYPGGATAGTLTAQRMTAFRKIYAGESCDA